MSTDKLIVADALFQAVRGSYDHCGGFEWFELRGVEEKRNPKMR